MNNIRKYKSLYIILAIILGVGAIIWVGYSRNSRQGKILVSIRTVPQDSTVKIDGKIVGRGNVSSYTAKGNHEVEVSREGFANSKDSFVANAEKIELDFGLLPTTAAGRELAKKNRFLYLEIEGREGERAQEAGQELRTANTILNVLPYRGVLFSIDYRLSKLDPERVVLQISGSNAHNRTLALQKIKSQGYEPSDYEIEFTGLQNNLALE